MSEEEELDKKIKAIILDHDRKLETIYILKDILESNTFLGDSYQPTILNHDNREIIESTIVKLVMEL